MKLVYTRRAARDLKDISDFLTPRSRQGARNVRDAILGSIEDLLRFPRIGRLQTTGDVRKLVVSRYPYLVFYTADTGGGEIRIITVRHAARQSGYSNL